MTLEETIQEFEDIAKEHMEKAEKSIHCLSFVNLPSLRDDAMGDFIVAEANNQVAEWLKELKHHRNVIDKTKEEIKAVKVRQMNALEANVKNETYNQYLAEYLKGYICALSTVEGIISECLENGEVKPG